ncbi:MAG: SPOR domain-containing protein [Ignavibacteria bacterium]|jgi:hypothetical protein|nr:SPOR domain-containing protein [Ignavibacteria bacterium]
MKIKTVAITILLTLLTSLALFSQSTTINSYLRFIAEGKIEGVKNKLPELIAKYGEEEPGILLLQGVVLENASSAIPYYKKIIERYPNSEWAPHAIWRMIQYYSIVTDTATAKRMLEKFREKYPTSPFLSAATDAVRLSISDAKYKNREKYMNPPKADTVEQKDVAKNDTAKAKETPAVVEKTKYGLQVGIYSTKSAAEAERDRFIRTARLRAEVLEKIVVGERKYAVVIGNYDSEEEADRAKSIVEKQCNCSPLIYKK